MDQHATCNRCSFGFWGGHSHHCGSSCCVCLSCLANFVCPTKSVWGPSIGEVIPICRVQTKGKKKQQVTEIIASGVVFVAEMGDAIQIGRSTFHGVHYPIETVPCPDCGAHSLCLGFEEGTPCPKCKVGLIATLPIEY